MTRCDDAGIIIILFYFIYFILSASGLLKRISSNIPKEYYKSLYYALFESHMSYCITVFGHVCQTHSEKLFTVQKHCMRILFGDKQAYLEKFKTCCRTRPFEMQKLVAKFYEREHTKPLFHKNGILTSLHIKIFITIMYA